MNLTLNILVFVACFISLVNAQTPMNSKGLEGRWILNQKESFSGSDRFYDDYWVSISERGPEITIETRIVRDKKVVLTKGVYFSDNRGEENLTTIGNVPDVPVKSNTKLKQRVLKIRYEYALQKVNPRQRWLFSGTFEYELEKSGDRLTFVHAYRGEFPDARSTFGQPSGSSGVTKWIFDRQ